MEIGKNWPSKPAFEMELGELQLLDGHEIFFQSDGYSGVGDYVTISIGLEGKPLILYTVAEIPMSIVKRMHDGHPVVFDGGAEGGGGLVPDPDFPGVPDRGICLYRVELTNGAEIRIQAHDFRFEDGFVYFSVRCHTEKSAVNYDLISVPGEIVGRDSDGALTIAILDQAAS